MTISSSNRKAGPFTGNDVSTVFAFPFKVFADDEIAVYKSNTLGIESLLAEGIDYTSTVNPNQDLSPGGSITTFVPLATGETLVIIGDVAYTQTLALTNGATMYPKNIETALDRIVCMVQQQKEEVDRCIKGPVTGTPGDYLAALVAQAEAAATAIDGLYTTLAESVINVRSLGAHGDGGTNDTAYFQTALSLAVSTGKPIYIPAGTYVVTPATLTVSMPAGSRIRMYGDGDKTCIIVPDGIYPYTTGLNPGKYDFLFQFRATGAGCSVFVNDLLADSNHRTAPAAPITKYEQSHTFNCYADTGGGFSMVSFHNVTVKDPHADGFNLGGESNSLGCDVYRVSDCRGIDRTAPRSDIQFSIIPTIGIVTGCHVDSIESEVVSSWLGTGRILISNTYARTLGLQGNNAAIEDVGSRRIGNGVNQSFPFTAEAVTAGRVQFKTMVDRTPYGKSLLYNELTDGTAWTVVTNADQRSSPGGTVTQITYNATLTPLPATETVIIEEIPRVCDLYGVVFIAPPNDALTAILSNVVIRDNAPLQHCKIIAANCDFGLAPTGTANPAFQALAVGSAFINCRFLHYVDSGLSRITGFNLRSQGGFDTDITFTDCDFRGDYKYDVPLTCNTSGTGYYLLSDSNPTAENTKRINIRRFVRCRFDSRTNNGIDCYRSGTWIFKDCTFGGTSIAMRVGGAGSGGAVPNALAGHVTIDGADFSKVTGTGIRIEHSSGTTASSLTLMGVHLGSAASSLQLGGTLTSINHKNGRKLYYARASFPAAAIPDDCVIVTDALLGQGYEYIATTGSVTSATWRMVRQKGVKKDTTANRPTVTATDVGALHLDTTLDADGKPIHYTGSAWVDATGAVV